MTPLQALHVDDAGDISMVCFKRVNEKKKEIRMILECFDLSDYVRNRFSGILHV